MGTTLQNTICFPTEVSGSRFQLIYSVDLFINLSAMFPMIWWVIVLLDVSYCDLRMKKRLVDLFEKAFDYKVVLEAYRTRTKPMLQGGIYAIAC